MTPANRMVKELLRLGVYLQREGARVTREFGLTQQQFVTLVVICEQEPMRQKDIVSDLLLEKSNVSKSVSRLEKLGLVSTRRDNRDGRVVLCEATDKGREVVKQCMQVMRAWNERWLAHVPDTELALVCRVLGTIGPQD